MKEFVLFFRMDILTKEAQPSQEKMKEYMKSWANWIDGISAKEQLTGGHHLHPSGLLLKPGNKITDGPYAEKNESVAGYITIEAENYDDAEDIAKKCPILQGSGTSVEIREIAQLP